MNNTGIQIAIADDHTLVRAGIVAIIEKYQGFSMCITAADGRELLEKIDTATLQPSVCLVDIQMPVMDGYDAIQELQKKHPFIRCLALTIFESEYPILKMLSLGAKGYLTKNINPADFLKAIVTVYNGGFYFSDQVLKKFPKISAHNIDTYTEQLFTEKETEFLKLCCSPMNYAEIGEQMHISKRTAENYGKHLCERLNFHTRLELGLYAQHAGIGNFKA